MTVVVEREIAGSIEILTVGVDIAEKVSARSRLKHVVEAAGIGDSVRNRCAGHVVGKIIRYAVNVLIGAAIGAVIHAARRANAVAGVIRIDVDDIDQLTGKRSIGRVRSGSVVDCNCRFRLIRAGWYLAVCHIGGYRPGNGIAWLEHQGSPCREGLAAAHVSAGPWSRRISVWAAERTGTKFLERVNVVQVAFLVVVKNRNPARCAIRKWPAERAFEP